MMINGDVDICVCVKKVIIMAQDGNCGINNDYNCFRVNTTIDGDDDNDARGDSIDNHDGSGCKGLCFW